MTSKAPLHPLMAQMFSSGLRKGERKKAEILARSIGILAEEGLDALSYDRLSKALNISKSHVAYHFPSLSSLLMKATEFITASAQSYVVQELSHSGAGMERLEAYVRGNFVWLKEQEQQAKVFLIFYYLASQQKEFADFNLKIRNASRERISAILSECKISEPVLRAKMAQMVLDLVTGGALECIILPPSDKWERTVDQKLKLCLEQLHLLLRA